MPPPTTAMGRVRTGLMPVRSLRDESSTPLAAGDTGARSVIARVPTTTPWRYELERDGMMVGEGRMARNDYSSRFLAIYSGIRSSADPLVSAAIRAQASVVLLLLECHRNGLEVAFADS